MRPPADGGAPGMRAVQPAPPKRSPRSEWLQNKGMGGLSFEETSCGTLKLSFEWSVGSKSMSKR